MSKSVKKITFLSVYAPVTTPKGNSLKAYTQALMSLLGMDTAGRKGVSLSAFKAFTGMARAYSYHSQKGNFEKDKGGHVRLTVSGRNFFHGRGTPANMVDDWKTTLQTGKDKNGAAVADLAIVKVSI